MRSSSGTATAPCACCAATGERRALLIERARPGTDISALPEDEATAIAVAVGRRLWRPAAEPFRWIGDHVPALARPGGALRVRRAAS